MSFGSWCHPLRPSSKSTWRPGGSIGQPRTARRYTTDTNCPLPTPEKRLLCILVYLKTYALQVVQGRLFGMSQSKAHQWIPGPVGRPTGDAAHAGGCAAGSVTALATRLGGDRGGRGAASGRGRSCRARPMRPPPQLNPSFPLLHMMGPNDASGVPRTYPTEQTRGYSGKKTCHTVKNVLLINAMLTMLFLSETSAGRTHDKRMADATADP